MNETLVPEKGVAWKVLRSGAQVAHSTLAPTRQLFVLSRQYFIYCTIILVLSGALISFLNLKKNYKLLLKVLHFKPKYSEHSLVKAEIGILCTSDP